eukprot:TRINITY_DN18038_c0_g1_i1.p1 TRINITY_DN18038_c0_g1~~TRINITY_DN18038_c0_g1_i1.p1  ORF type:complete len:468 (-),score=128.67 TRINITY_DN18038_c0_g1_i1:41-1414(-)
MQKAPLWLIVFAQVLSTAGDAFGQRVSRKHHGSSRRKMLVSLTLMNASQMLVFLLACEWLLPASVTGAVYVDGEKVMCWQEIDGDHKEGDCDATKCHAIPCPPQGPVTAMAALYYYPFLLFGGCVNWLYYSGEVWLYKEALGLLFLVLANLASSFLVNPIMYIFDLPVSSNVPAAVYVMGIFGALLCTIEKVGIDFWSVIAKLRTKLGCPPKAAAAAASSSSSVAPVAGEHDALLAATSATASAHNYGDDDDKKYPKNPSWKQRVLPMLTSCLNVLIPFAVLSFAYAIWFCLQIVYNDYYHINVFSFTTVDKVLLLFYVAPYLLMVDTWPGFKSLFENPAYQHENYVTSVVNAWRESTNPWWNMVTLFVFRALVNGRSLIYFYLAVLYDPNSTYLELTLVRIILSWVGVVLVVLCFPKFIGATNEERRKVFEPIGISLKLIGTIIIVLSLFVLNGLI